VAVLLDVNKRALFARAANGRFVARQIVAVSEHGLLVCHNVYPRKQAKALENFFQLYVEDWSTQLGLPIATGDDAWEAQEVKPLTLQRWYEDGLWDRYGKRS